jgi:hypothetical protein
MHSPVANAHNLMDLSEDADIKILYEVTRDTFNDVTINTTNQHHTQHIKSQIL